MKSNVILKILEKLFAPVAWDFPFFVAMLFLIAYRAIYMLVFHPIMFSYDWTQYPRLRIVGISMVISYILTTIVFVTNSKFIKYALYSMGVVLFSLNIFLYLSFDSGFLTSTLLRVFETNTNEISNFASSYIFTRTGLFTLIIIIVLTVLCCLWDRSRYYFSSRFQKMRPLLQKTAHVIFAITMLCGLYSFHIYYELFQCKNTDETDSWFYNVNFLFIDQITNGVFSFYSLSLAGDNLTTAVKSTRTASEKGARLKWLEDSTNVILVIGESHIKSHSSIYGYTLRTNPGLERERKDGRLYVFSDVITPYIYTSEAVRNMLSTNSLGDHEEWYDYPYVPAIFHSAGYHVMFWDNEYIKSTGMPFDFTLNAYLHSPEMSCLSYDSEHGYVSDLDGDMLDDVERELDETPNYKYNLLVLHLFGQHFSQDNHYPQTREFQHFIADDIQRSEAWMTHEKKQEIAHYDNCTLYNDFLLCRILKLFSGKSAVMIYLSDHGENIYDIGDYTGRRECDLRGDGIHQLLEVPFVVWCSDRYKANHPNIAEKLECSKDKPMMTDNLSHLLMSLGGGDF